MAVNQVLKINQPTDITKGPLNCPEVMGNLEKYWLEPLTIAPLMGMMIVDHLTTCNDCREKYDEIKKANPVNSNIH
jgi:ABC-type iron transport system FetAB permease component